MLPADLGRKSVCRNPLIADLLHRIEFIENGILETLLTYKLSAHLRYFGAVKLKEVVFFSRII
jgi:hypothetical protein